MVHSDMDHFLYGFWRYFIVVIRTDRLLFWSFTDPWRRLRFDRESRSELLLSIA